MNPSKLIQEYFFIQQVFCMEFHLRTYTPAWKSQREYVIYCLIHDNIRTQNLAFEHFAGYNSGASILITLSLIWINSFGMSWINYIILLWLALEEKNKIYNEGNITLNNSSINQGWFMDNFFTHLIRIVWNINSFLMMNLWCFITP